VFSLVLPKTSNMRGASIFKPIAPKAELNYDDAEVLIQDGQVSACLCVHVCVCTPPVLAISRHGLKRIPPT
jgi:hypothetical protein